MLLGRAGGVGHEIAETEIGYYDIPITTYSV